MTDQREAPLIMWTVYSHPSDYPDKFVARKFEIRRGGVTIATSDVRIADTLAKVRTEFIRRGLHPLARSQEDEPQIVETWI